MQDLIRETVFGRLAHLASGGKFFPPAEQRDPSRVERYMVNNNDNKSASGSETSITAADQDVPSNENEKKVINPEQGTDFELIDWIENDPEACHDQLSSLTKHKVSNQFQQNPRNWSSTKKVFVTFQICFLTVAVYIGSAIYTAGLLGVMKQFHVSDVAALLGLTLFVIGYALGPMILVNSAPPFPPPLHIRFPLLLLTPTLSFPPRPPSPKCPSSAATPSTSAR